MIIVWTEKAAANLHFFTGQVKEISGLSEVGEKFYTKVIDKVSKLEERPEWRGIPVKEYPGAGYRSLSIMDYRIIFKVSSSTVFIVTFVHKRMLLDGRV